MWVILPAVSFAALFVALSARLGSGDLAKCWRESFLFTSVTGGLVVVISSELLSIFHVLTLGGLVAVWGAVAIAAVLFCRGQLMGTKPRLHVGGEGWHWQLTVAVAGVSGIVLVAGLLAIITPPNEWDSMVYHMSRVAHWAQNRTIAFYPTQELRQLIFGPGAELAVLHGYILSGTDRFANLVQWFCMVGSVIGVSLIARQLGADSSGQVLAATVAATIPMGILQAASTQNDYAAAFWMVCFVVGILADGEGRIGWRRMAAGASLGLALLVKATGYIFAAPFVVWMGVRELRKKPGRGFVSLALVAALALVLNAGFYLRNLQLSGSPLGMAGGTGAASLVNSVRTVPAVVSNVARNLSLHLGTPSGKANRALERALVGLHRLLGIGIADPRTTYGVTSFTVSRPSTYEGWAGNPFHVLLIALALVLLLATPFLRARRVLAVYAAVMVSQFLVFSLLLKWQPWSSRLQLPMFVLSGPLVGVVLSRALSRRAGFAVTCLCLLFALPYLLMNTSRPLVCLPGEAPALLRGRARAVNNVWHRSQTEQYFTNRLSRLVPYTGAAEYLNSRGSAAVGLLMEQGEFEYPLWVLLEQERRVRRIEYVGSFCARGPVPYPLGPFHPDAILATDSLAGTTFRFGGDVFVERWASGAVRVLVKEGSADSAAGRSSAAP